MPSLKTKKGFSLVEMLVMIFVATFSILVIWKVYAFFVKISLSNPSFFQASFLAEEGIEAVKFMRDTSWSSKIVPLTSDTPYTLVFDGTAWNTVTGYDYILGKFDRRVVFSDVYRDISGNIADSGTLDLNTKKVIVTVSWQKDSATSTRQIKTYVSDIFKN